jgi:hypothetical protein
MMQAKLQVTYLLFQPLIVVAVAASIVASAAYALASAWGAMWGPSGATAG